jgi:protein-disulfide isomerase
MVEIEKEIKREERKIEKFFKSKTNVWMSVAILLAVVLVIIGIFSMAGSVSKAAAGQKVVDFAKAQGVSLEVLGVASKGTFYEVNVSIQGQDMPVYVTKDGKYFTSNIVALETVKKTTTTSKTSSSKTVPKTDKPKADLYVFSYCPYGLQVEKAVAPVYDLLKDKAEINLVHIGAMHGEYEKTEAIRQLCIQDSYGKDKLWDYLKLFYVNTAISSCQGADSCLSPLLSKIYSQTGIDSSKVNSCMTNNGLTLYSANTQQASSLSISGSPTWVINGVQSQVGRSPEEVKKAICSAFTTAPTECSQTLSTAQAAPSFGSGSSTGTAASCG